MLQTLYDFLTEREKKDFYIATAGYVGTILGITGIMIYYFYAHIHSLQNDIKKINKNRQEMELFLQKYKVLQKQKDAVNTLLTQEKNFKIKNFFDSAIQQSHLQANLRQ